MVFFIICMYNKVKFYLAWQRWENKLIPDTPKTQKIDRKKKKKEVSPERKANCLLRSGVMSAAHRGLLSNCMISSGQKTERQISVTSEFKLYEGRLKLISQIRLIIKFCFFNCHVSNMTQCKYRQTETRWIRIYSHAHSIHTTAQLRLFMHTLRLVVISGPMETLENCSVVSKTLACCPNFTLNCYPSPMDPLH